MPGFPPQQSRRATHRPPPGWRRALLTFFPLAAFLLPLGTAVSYLYSQGDVALARCRVYTSGALPAELGATWKERGDASAPLHPIWNPVAGRPVGVDTAGDLAVVDAREIDTDVTISVALTNAGAMGGNYSYLMLPIRVYEQDGSGQWTPARTGADILSERHLTLQDGVLSIVVDGGKCYAITVATGGSIHAVNTLEDALHTMSPSFLVSTDAQPRVRRRRTSNARRRAARHAVV